MTPPYVTLSFLLATAVCPACTRDNPVSCADGYCQDPSLPFCDVDGALAGDRQTCIAVDCTSGDVAGCRGDSAIVCNAGGDNYDLSHCDHGCDPVEGCKSVSCVPNTTKCGDRVVETCSANGVLTTQACDVACVDAPSPHCAYISPKYLPDVCDTPAVEASRTITVSETIDTNIDATCNGGIVLQTNGPDICVVRYGTFAIEAVGSWRVTGARTLAIVADETLRVTGLIDVSSNVGGIQGAGASGNYGGLGTEEPKGGAGFATAGGNGGGSPGSGGAAYDPLGVGFFVGGRQGGTRSTYCGAGGGGGGAVTLISCKQRVLVEGIVQAGGGGGRGGRASSQGGSCPGGGGGAGGYVVLQGVDVRVSGSMFANGGGGGCGRPTGSTGLNGPDGRRVAGAPTACVPTGTEGAGGAGGSLGFPPGSGGSTSGGGGGSMGFFQAYTPTGVIPTLTPAVASPAFQPTLPLQVR